AAAGGDRDHAEDAHPAAPGDGEGRRREPARLSRGPAQGRVLAHPPGAEPRAGGPGDVPLGPAPNERGGATDERGGARGRFTGRPRRVAQGCGRRLQRLNVLKKTMRTSPPPPLSAIVEDRPYPTRALTKVLQGPENSRATPPPTRRSVPAPKSSGLWMKPASSAVLTRTDPARVKAYPASATRPLSKWMPDPLKPCTRAVRKSPSSKRENRSRLFPSYPDKIGRAS